VFNLSLRKAKAMKLHVVEQLHYEYDREAKTLRRQPYKVFRINATSNEGAADVRQAINDLVQDLTVVSSHLNGRE
jgi:hypothetical protein